MYVLYQSLPTVWEDEYSDITDSLADENAVTEMKIDIGSDTVILPADDSTDVASQNVTTAKNNSVLLDVNSAKIDGENNSDLNITLQMNRPHSISNNGVNIDKSLVNLKAAHETSDDVGEHDIVDIIQDPLGFTIFDYNDPVFDLTQLSKHQSDYESIFRTFPNYQKESKILAYRCVRDCGGWADRLKGIIQAYMLSLLSKRKFAIVMKEPSDIEHFLTPNLLNWHLNENDTSNLSVGEVDNKFLHDAIAVQYERFDYDPEKLFDKDLVYVIANQDWTRTLRKLSVAPSRFPEIYKYHSSDLTRIIYHGLFKPTTELLSLVDEFFDTQTGGKKLACLHARMGEQIYLRYTFDEIMTPLQFLKDHYSGNDYKVMIATDNNKVKNFSKTFFPNFVDTSYSGPIMHIDYMRNASRDDDIKERAFMRSMVDHMILTRCDTLVLTASGFGISAGMLRHTSRNLYVYVKEGGAREIVPVRRETLRELFQYNCLSQLTTAAYICDA